MSLELAGLLVTQGILPASLVDDALRRQVLAGGAFDTALFEAGANLSEAACLQLLSQASGLPSVDAQGLSQADPALAPLLPAKLAERHCLLPLRSDGRVLEVAAAFPVDAARLEEIGFLLGRELRPSVSVEARLREAIARVYAIALPARHASVLALLGLVDGALPAASAPTPPPTPLAAAKRASPTPRPDPMASALAKAAATHGRTPRAAPRDKVDVDGLAVRIASAAGGKPGPDSEPIDSATLASAREAIDRAQDRHQIVRIALRFALKTFDFAAALGTVGGNAVGWAALTRQGPADERVEKVSVPLDAPSVLRTVLLTRGRYLGPVPPDPLSQSLIVDMDRPPPAAAFFSPVEVRERPVAIVYADLAGRSASDIQVAELVLLLQHVGRRFERLVLEQKRKLNVPAAPPVQAAARAAPRPSPTPVPPPAPSSLPAQPAAFSLSSPSPTSAELFARSPSRRQESSLPRFDDDLPVSLSLMPAPGISRVASSKAPTYAPPTMDELFAAADRLVEPDPIGRAKALAELLKAPEVAAAVLVARFPGPLSRARLPVSELPSPEELGPIPLALSRIGAGAARALAPLLQHKDVDLRYFAILTAGRLPSPFVVNQLAERVFDRHPVVASAARAALAAMRAVPEFDQALASIRTSLYARDPETASQAARALGGLHDLDAIPRLIELTEAQSQAVSQAAADALRDICKQTFGVNAVRWTEWWHQHSGRSRTEWLVMALRHRDFDIRLSAIDELVRAVNDNFGYYADGPLPEREQGARKWEEWLRAQGGKLAPIV